MQRRSQSPPPPRKAALRRVVKDALAIAIAMTVLLAGIARPSTPLALAADDELEDNKNLVRRYFAIAGQGDLQTLTDVVSPNLVVRTAPPGQETTLQSLRQTLAQARAGLPDFAFQIDDLFAEGDLVVARTTISGTHLGTFFGAPATGKRIEIAAIDVWRVADGKLSEVWHYEDILGVMQQLGALPANLSGMNPSPTVAAELRQAFPDLTFEIEQVIAEGDRVAITWTMRGTQHGAFRGLPASGRQITTSGADIYRVADNRIVEKWTVGDDLGLLMQLGAIPAFDEPASTPIAAAICLEVEEIDKRLPRNGLTPADAIRRGKESR